MYKNAWNRCSLFLQQFFNAATELRFAVRAVVAKFAFPVLADMALFVNEVHGRPVFLPPTVPVRAVAIHKYGIGDVVLLDGAGDIHSGFFAPRFGRMDADNLHILRRKLLLQPRIRGQIMPTIDAAIRPEMYHRNFAPARRQRDGHTLPGVEPRPADQFLRRFVVTFLSVGRQEDAIAVAAPIKPNSRAALFLKFILLTVFLRSAYSVRSKRRTLKIRSFCISIYYGLSTINCSGSRILSLLLLHERHFCIEGFTAFGR